MCKIQAVGFSTRNPCSRARRARDAFPQTPRLSNSASPPLHRDREVRAAHERTAEHHLVGDGSQCDYLLRGRFDKLGPDGMNSSIDPILGVALILPQFEDMKRPFRLV